MDVMGTAMDHLMPFRRACCVDDIQGLGNGEGLRETCREGELLTEEETNKLIDSIRCINIEQFSMD